jgi:hypothetical protein
MPEKKAVARLTAEITRRLREVEANAKAFASDLDVLMADHAGRYAVYRQQRLEAVTDTFIEAARHLNIADGFPASIHEITTKSEPGLLRRKPPQV